MRRRKEFLARFGERLDIPREALPGGFGLSLSGQNELTVRGCRRILSYGSECIRLSLGRTALSVTGERLLCTVFEAGNVTVEGRICAIAFEEEEKKRV
ncbi:MAG: YabP/YqfC family sporulation protein [Clostridia bacterium]|nr:YabP/YqfC family sporulation protein [Clostridia bacterium]